VIVITSVLLPHAQLHEGFVLFIRFLPPMQSGLQESSNMVNAACATLFADDKPILLQTLPAYSPRIFLSLYAFHSPD